MVANNAGGFGFVLDDWERLTRFLIIGSESNTYYSSAQKLTEQNAQCVVRCLKSDGPRTIAAALDVSVNNRAPKTDQQLFVLALAMKHGDLPTKRAVSAAAPKMLRTGTHLLHFVAMLDSLGGWSRAKRRLVQDWFLGQEADRVAYQVLKYQNRDSWAQRDALRVSHAKPYTEAHDAVLSWVTGKTTMEKILHMPSILVHHSAMNVMEGTPVEKALWGIAHNIPREALPTEALGDLSVQAAMLPDMPLHALVRNLGNMTASGLLTQQEHATVVAQKITDKVALKKARVHPFAILLATLVYKTGRGVRGAKTWVPNKTILFALEDAYDLAFDFVEPTNKRMLIGVDISGSMSAACMGTAISASTAATAMAVTLGRLEPNATVVQFDTAVQRILPITKRTGIASIESTHGGGTDLSAPVRWATGAGEDSQIRRSWFLARHQQDPAPAPVAAEYDAFVILTDNETWAGRSHPTEALTAYRKKMNRRAKLVCCAFTASHANIVDPQDPLQFGTVGLDANLPSLVGDFIRR